MIKEFPRDLKIKQLKDMSFKAGMINARGKYAEWAAVDE